MFGAFIIGIIFMIISFVVSSRLKSKFEKYSKIGLRNNMSGAEIAVKMLNDNGIYDVKVVSVEGSLTDHYNPADKTVNLSKDVYYGRSAASAAVASHECGHAVQHATAYSMLGLRSKLVPVQQISATILTYANLVLMFGGGLLYGSGIFSSPLLLVLIAANLGITLFSLITLPVEFDASKRALAWIENNNIVSSQEHSMAKDALNWAALTYVVAALGAIAQLLYWVMMFLGRGNDD